jgi:hypothetical protein
MNAKAAAEKGVGLFELSERRVEKLVDQDLPVMMGSEYV